jgi:hypothetical protein
MPTTIDSAGITFNDTTSLTSANIGTAQLVNGSVTAAKLGTNEQRQIAKAWVNFDGANIQVSVNAATGFNLSVTSGSQTGSAVSSSTFPSSWVGQIFYITSIGGVVGATLGGVNVATSGIQFLSVSGTTATFILIAGAATSTQTINGNATSSGFVFTTYGIRSSYNVSSVTKNGTGDYTVNFSTAMADANYSAALSTTPFSSPSNNHDFSFGIYGSYASGATGRTVSSLRVQTGTITAAAALDGSELCVQIFGN